MAHIMPIAYIVSMTRIISMAHILSMAHIMPTIGVNNIGSEQEGNTISQY